MGTKLECMDVLYIISEFQFQEGGAPRTQSNHLTQGSPHSLEALLRLGCTKNVWAWGY